MSQRFNIIAARLSGLLVVQRKPIEDSRGFFTRFFCSETFQELGLTKPIQQINHSLTRKKGAVRGMHFQYTPYAECKIVSCLRGRIFDVAVDIRKGSPTFLQWHGEELSEDNFKTMVIPEGFAHGFQTLTEDCEIFYLVSAPYMGAYEGAINPGDPIVSIKWPLNVSQLSDKDDSTPLVGQDFRGVEI
ncbi:MAG: dTDP-4-dehydrorhamnose 3,5-epimerase [Deltaproteobacteria bacterium]|nr:dTDP-4-dehydrorhamnose 3,5-epimerase [Deltaproteobacteria bacterium]